MERIRRNEDTAHTMPQSKNTTLVVRTARSMMMTDRLPNISKLNSLPEEWSDGASTARCVNICTRPPVKLKRSWLVRRAANADEASTKEVPLDHATESSKEANRQLERQRNTRNATISELRGRHTGMRKTVDIGSVRKFHWCMAASLSLHPCLEIQWTTTPPHSSKTRGVTRGPRSTTPVMRPLHIGALIRQV